jgi:hypothetical protein
LELGENWTWELVRGSKNALSDTVD